MPATRYAIDAPAGTACKCGRPATVRTVTRFVGGRWKGRVTQTSDRCDACHGFYLTHLAWRDRSPPVPRRTTPV